MAAPLPSPPSLLLLRDLETRESDFACAASALSHARAGDSDGTRAVLHVGGVVAATTGVGFVEACLHFERRPIPLRFAVRYALANVLPSVVWKSVAADVVAAASNVARSSLITSAASLQTSSTVTPSTGVAVPMQPLSVARAKQLVVLKSVRSVRQFLGSYALAWTLWLAYARTSTAPDNISSNNNVNDKGSAAAPAIAERVVRLAPEDSALSRASRRRHGDHIATVPLSTSTSNKPHASALAIDWRTLGLARAVHSDALPTESPPLQLLEVELNDIASVSNARRVLQKAVYDLPDERLQSVAVLPPQPLAVAALDAFDICVSPLAAVLHAIASVCASTRESQAPVLLVHADDASRTPLALSADLERGLLYQHGIVTTRSTLDHVLSSAAAAHDQDDAPRDSDVRERPRAVIVVAARAVDGRAAAHRLIADGAAMREDVVVVCEESARDEPATGALARLPALLLQRHASSARFAPAAVLSLADTGDVLLQRVRELLRSGHSADAIQRALYSAFGAQKTLQRRRDALSDLDGAFN